MESVCFCMFWASWPELHANLACWQAGQGQMISWWSQAEHLCYILSDFPGEKGPAYIISEKELQQILRHAPKWWGTEDKEKYDNLIFILSDDSPQEILDMIGPVSEGLEQIEIYQNIIFWTFDRKSYQKCNWWKKTASSSIAEKLTIRTAGTIKKVCK